MANNGADSISAHQLDPCQASRTLYSAHGAQSGHCQTHVHQFPKRQVTGLYSIQTTKKARVTNDFGLSCSNRPDMPGVQYARIVFAVHQQPYCVYRLPSRRHHFCRKPQRSCRKQQSSTSCAWKAVPNFVVRFCINMLGSSL